MSACDSRGKRAANAGAANALAGADAARLDRTRPSAGNRSGTGSAAAFGDAKPAVRKRRLAGTDGQQIGAAIDLSSPWLAKKADGESKALKLRENGRARFSSPFSSPDQDTPQ
jgi:hypothetical protein